MKSKRLYVILIAVAYVLALALSFTYIFTLKNINIEYNVAYSEESIFIEEKLNDFKGKSLVFLDEAEIEDALLEFVTFKTLEVKKVYPNSVSIKLFERQPIFAVNLNNGSYAVIDAEGVVLEITQAFSPSREIILIDTVLTGDDNGLAFNELKAGSKISTNDDQMFYAVIAMAKKINLYNCIKSIKLDKNVLKQYAYFTTYTGVELEIPQVLERGEDKIEVAFNEYDSYENDYTKSFDKITVSVQQDDTIKAVWSKKS